MATIADLAVRGRADLGEIYRIPQEVQRVMQRASQATQQAGRRMESTTMTPRDFRELESRTRNIEAGFQRLNRTASLVGRTLGSLGVGVGVGAIVREVASATAEMDSLERNLVAVLGNAAEARKEFEVLREISTAPGIDLAAAVKGATQLDAVEQNLPLVNRQLREFANAVALAGGSGPDLERVVLQLTQSAAAGKLLMADWRPIIQTAPLVGRAMIEAFGTLDLEEIQARGITMQEFFDRLLDAMEKMPRATDGAANAWDNLRSAVSQVSAAYGKDLAPSVQRGMNALSSSLVDLSKNSRDMRALADGTLALGEALLVGGAVVGLVRLARALRDVEAATAALQAIRGPQGWLVLGVGALAYELYRQGDAARDAAAALDEYQARLAGMSGDALASEHQRQSGIYATVKRQIDALKPLIDQQEELSRDPTANLQQRAATDSALARNQKSYQRLGEILSDTAGRIRELREAEVGLTTTTTKTSTGLGDVAEILSKEKAAVDLLASTYTELEARKIDASRVVLQGEDLAAGLFARAQAAPMGSELRAGLLALERQLADALHIPLQVELSASAVHDLQDQLDRNEFTVTAKIAAPSGPSGTLDLGIVDVGEIQSSYQDHRQRVEAVLAEAEETKRAAVQHLNDTLEAVRNITSGFEDLADVLGDVSPAMSGAIRGIQSLINGAAAVKAGQAKGGALGTLAQIGGYIGIAAGVAQVASALTAEPEWMQEWREVMARNSQELRDLGVKLSGFRSTFDTRRAAAAALPQITGGYTPGRAVAPRTDEIRSILRGFGLTLEQLAVIAQGVGVTILDSAGRVIPGALVQLNKALHDASRSVQEFGKSFEGQQRLADARLEIFDLSGPLDQLKSQYALLAKTAPDLLKEFGLANLNLDSAGAQRVLEQGLRDVFDALQSGQLAADQLGGFADVGEFLDSLLGTDRALDGLADTASKVSDALTNVPQGFRIFNAELARFNAQAAATAASLSGSTSGAPPQTIGSDTAPWVPRTRPLEPAGTQVEYNDHRTVTNNIYQQPGESNQDLVRRLEKMMDEKARRDNLTNGKLPTDPWSPRP